MFDNKVYIFLLFLILPCQKIFPIFPINLFKYVNLRDETWKNKKFEFGLFFEKLITKKFRDENGFLVGILESQNTLPIFNINDNQTKIKKGYFLTAADLHGESLLLTGKYYFPHNLSFETVIPFLRSEVNNVNWITKALGASNAPINLSIDFFKVGDLNIGKTKDTNIGDIFLLTEWRKNYEIKNKILKYIIPSFLFAFTIPTGTKIDPDILFSIPTGNDGSWAFIVGGEVDFFFKPYLGFMTALNFISLTSTTRDRRLTTTINNVDFLIPAKGNTKREYGLTTNLNIALMAYRFIKGLSFRIAMQNIWHNEDCLSLLNPKEVQAQFNNVKINTAITIDRWSLNQLIFILDYSFLKRKEYQDNPVPHIFFFYKKPVSGTRKSLSASSFGIVIDIGF